MTHILEDRRDSVLILTMNRPDKKNALTQDMYKALADAVNGAQADPTVRVIYLTGTADSFTAGNDLADFAGGPGKSNGDLPPVAQYLQAILLSEKPIVAAVNGLAIGVGVTMLLHCDLVYAARSATLQTPFVNLGLVPEAGSSLLLPRAVGTQKANEMFLLGKKLSAAEAESAGLIAAAVDDDKLQETAFAAASALAAKAPGAVRLTKQLVRGDREAIARQMALESEAFQAQLKTPEFAEAASAFAERRAPDFSKVA